MHDSEAPAVPGPILSGGLGVQVAERQLETRVHLMRCGTCRSEDFAEVDTDKYICNSCGVRFSHPPFQTRDRSVVGRSRS